MRRMQTSAGLRSPVIAPPAAVAGTRREIIFQPMAGLATSLVMGKCEHQLTPAARTIRRTRAFEDRGSAVLPDHG